MSNNLPKLVVFILVLAAYMYVYDPSCGQFIHSAKAALNFHLNDRFILNTIVWLMGFWGIILFLNSKSHFIKIPSWALFIATMFVEFAYVNINHQSVSLENIDQLEIVSQKLSELQAISLMKFFGMTAVVIGVAFTTRPVAPAISTTFIVVLVLGIVLVTVAHKGHGVVLPAFYLVPVLMLYKWIMVLIAPPAEVAYPIVPK